MAKPKFKRDETVTVPSVGVGTVKVVMRINNGWVYKVEFRGGYQEEFPESKVERVQEDLFQGLTSATRFHMK
jgi:hypothetical protein